MTPATDSLLKVDWSQVSQQIKDGLATGKMIFSQAKGTVYWAAGSGHSGIAAHLPLVPVTPDDVASAQQLLQLGQAVKAGQAAAMTATVISTVAIAAVVVVATAYLAKKIKNVQRVVDELKNAVGLQGQLDFLKQVSEYLAAVKSADELLSSGAPAEEIRRLAEQRIDRLAELRLQTQGYVSGVLKLAFVAGAAESTYRQAAQFAIEMLDLVPTALVVERDLCLVAGLTGMAESRGREPTASFREALTDFRQHCDGEYRRLAAGQGGFADTLHDLRGPLNELFQSPTHTMLLDGMNRPISWQAVARQPAESHESVTLDIQAPRGMGA